LTDDGRAKANISTNLITDNASAQEDIKERFKIGGKSAELFEMLRDGRVHDREYTLGSLGHKSKNSASVMLSTLKKYGVIEFDRTTIKMTDICFPYGRPEQTEEY